MQIHSRLYLLIGLLCFYMYGTADCLAEEFNRVSAVYPDGVLEFEGGDKVRLAGVELAPETIKFLPALVADNILEMKDDAVLSLSPENTDAIRSVYIYIKTRELRLPFVPQKQPSEQKVMLNELLLEMGAAQVVADVEFERRKEFLRIQEEAKARGEGIWSYDFFDKRPSKNPT